MDMIKTFAVCCLFACLPASAQMHIEIAGPASGKIPIAVAVFAGEEASAPALAAVVKADLERNGMFELVDNDGSAVAPSTLTFRDGARAAPMRSWWGRCAACPTSASRCATGLKTR
jgi:TolB protein